MCAHVKRLTRGKPTFVCIVQDLISICEWCTKLPQIMKTGNLFTIRNGNSLHLTWSTVFILIHGRQFSSLQVTTHCYNLKKCKSCVRCIGKLICCNNNQPFKTRLMWNETAGGVGLSRAPELFPLRSRRMGPMWRQSQHWVCVHFAQRPTSREPSRWTSLSSVARRAVGFINGGLPKQTFELQPLKNQMWAKSNCSAYEDGLEQKTEWVWFPVTFYISRSTTCCSERRPQLASQMQ
jgi:hypothetical protein